MFLHNDKSRYYIKDRREDNKSDKKTSTVSLALFMAAGCLSNKISYYYYQTNFRSGGQIMRKNLKKVGAVLTASAVALTSIFTLGPAKTAEGADDFVVEKDPYVIAEEDAQPYNTADLKLTPGLTYVKDGKEIEVTGAIDTQSFCADPTCMEVDGKIYVYGTTDQRSYQKNSSTTTNNKEDGPVVENKYQTKKLSIFSSSDLVNWTDEGFIDMDKVFSDSGKPAGSGWAGKSWAPSALKYDCDGDGKDEYYIFFTNGGNVGYVKGETPTGPWKDELGELLIDKGKIPNGMGTGIIWNFDPAVLLDNKGDAYIYWGGGNGSTPELQKHPKTSRSCKLKISADKVEMDWDTITELDSYYHFEDNEINQFGDKYVYTYCANWNVPASNKYIKDGSVSIVGYVSDDPLNVTSDPENWQEGDPKFIGKILKNPGSELFDEYYNNHHHMFEFKDKYYMLYHTTALDQFLYKDFYTANNKKSYSYRNLHIDEIKVDVESDEPTIDVKPSYAGPEQVGKFNPYQTINATTQSHQGGISTAQLEDGKVVVDKIDTGDWTRIDGVDFGSNGATKLEASVASATTQGSIEVYLDEALTGTKIATLQLKDTGADTYETLSANLENVTGVHDVYFVFRGTDYRVASWTFTEKEAPAPSATPTPGTPAPATPAPGTPVPTVTPAPSPTVTPSMDKVSVAKPAIKSVKNVKGKKAKVTLKKKINGANGYEIRYSLKKTMKSAKKVTIKKANTLKVTISKLKKSKTYYVQARAYKTVNGKKYYSSWSGKKNVKIKK